MPADWSPSPQDHRLDQVEHELIALRQRLAHLAASWRTRAGQQEYPVVARTFELCAGELIALTRGAY